MELLEFIASSLPTQYQIKRTANGEQGLTKALPWMPDLLINDLVMPVMDGDALCQQLKKDESTSAIPVMLLTAKAALDSRMQGLAQGMDDYLYRTSGMAAYRRLSKQKRIPANDKTTGLF